MLQRRLGQLQAQLGSVATERQGGCVSEVRQAATPQQVIPLQGNSWRLIRCTHTLLHHRGVCTAAAQSNDWHILYSCWGSCCHAMHLVGCHLCWGGSPAPPGEGSSPEAAVAPPPPASKHMHKKAL
jgi:hypothetical protein